MTNLIITRWHGDVNGLNRAAPASDKLDSSTAAESPILGWIAEEALGDRPRLSPFRPRPGFSVPGETKSALKELTPLA